MSVKERIAEFQKVLKEKGIHMYIVPTSDFHQSEYVGEYFKARKFITGFSGSAGVAVITPEEAGLWVDGRYFIQAANEIKDSGVILYRMGEPKVPEITEFIEEKLPEGGVLGFDGRTVSMQDGSVYEDIVNGKNGSIRYEEDLIDRIWKDRPGLSEKKAFDLPEKNAGESVTSKLSRIREEMKKHEASMHLLTTLDDICWTMNIRGNDIEFFPLVLSYALITMEEVILYIPEGKLTAETMERLGKEGVRFAPYNNIYRNISELKVGERLLVDPDKINYAIYSNIPDGVKILKAQNPSILFKAIKNDTEIENIRKAQMKDSLCYIRFMKWIKENWDKKTITEMSACAELERLRKEQGNYISPSFAPICAYGEHSALCHYESSEETDTQLKEGNFFLADTGGGYLEGSTDITRTFALGEVSSEKKTHFTLVAISNLQLAAAKFLYGTSGLVLDILARKPFWDRNLNYNHGTGHGVGYLLNIHEGPTGFRWKYRTGEAQALEEGMILTDEPGIYFEGSHGVRLENELLVRNGEMNGYGQFMYFEPITYVPFDLDAVIPDMLSEDDRNRLNEYHELVFEMMKNELDQEEQEWLRHYTRAI